MSVRRNPIYVFKDQSSVGIGDVPVESVIQIIDSDGVGTPLLTLLTDKTGLGNSSTIADYLGGIGYTDLDKDTVYDDTALVGRVQVLEDDTTDADAIIVLDGRVQTLEDDTTDADAITALNSRTSNVENTTDANKPVSTATQTALDLKVDNTRVLTDVPAGALFTDTDTDTIYDDTAIVAAVALNTVKVSFDTKGATDTHVGTVSGNPHAVSATDVGLGSVDNTSDAVKALVGNAVGDAIALKVDNTRVLTDVPAGALFIDTVYDSTVNDAAVALNTAKVTDLVHPLVETAVPIGALFIDTVYDDTVLDGRVTALDTRTSNVDNTADADKPISTATQNALTLKLSTGGASGSFTNTPGTAFTITYADGLITNIA